MERSYTVLSVTNEILNFPLDPDSAWAERALAGHGLPGDQPW